MSKMRQMPETKRRQQHLMYLDFPVFSSTLGTQVNTSVSQSLQLSVSRSIYYLFPLLPYQSCTSTKSCGLRVFVVEIWSHLHMKIGIFLTFSYSLQKVRIVVHTSVIVVATSVIVVITSVIVVTPAIAVTPQLLTV